MTPPRREVTVRLSPVHWTTGRSAAQTYERFHCEHTPDEPSVPTKQHATKRSNDGKNVSIAVGFDVSPKGTCLEICHCVQTNKTYFDV